MDFTYYLLDLRKILEKIMIESHTGTLHLEKSVGVIFFSSHLGMI